MIHSDHTPSGQLPSRNGPTLLFMLVIMFSTSHSLLAQTQLGNKRLRPEPATLQVRLDPLIGTSTLLLRVANQARGTAHILIRDHRGQTLYNGSHTKNAFALPLDVASMPVGTYTIEISTWVARDTQIFRIGPMLAGRPIDVLDDSPISLSHENPDN